MEESQSPAARPASINGLLVFFLLARTLMNTVHRIVYPFLPVLSRAFGVTPAVFSQAVSIRYFGGLANIYLSRYTDSHGRKFGMLLGNGCFVGGIALIVLWPSFPTFVVGLGLSSLGKFVMDAAIQSFLGDEIPVRSRGRAIGIVELGWSLSYLVGIWGVRVLLERGGWLAPFPVLGLLGVAMWAGFVAWVPAGRRTSARPDSIRNGATAILQNRAAVLALLMGLAITSANELVTVVFAIWLEDSFGFNLAGLAAAAILIGFAELGGESLVGVLTDRLGAARAVASGLALNCLFALLLPVFGRSPAGAFIGLFLFFLTFEFTVVSGISLITEVPTGARATLMAFNIAFLTIGRIVAAWVALPIYGLGFSVVLGIAVVINAGGLWALRALAVYLRESDPSGL